MFASMASAIAAMFCKEFVVTLPIMLALYEFLFLGSLNETMWKRCGRLVPFFIIALIVPVLLLRTPPQAIGVAAIADSSIDQEENVQKDKTHIDITRARGGVSRKKYFLTELNVVCTYVRLLFLPVNQNFDYDYPISNSLDGKTLLAGIFLLFLITIAVITYKSYRVVSFGILWFFIALSVESSFIPIGHVIAEYRVYLASFGFVSLVTVLIYSRPIDIRKLNMIAVIILAALSVLTYQRNKVWKNDIVLWSDTIHKSPHKARGYSNRGTAYFKQGQLTKAIADFNTAISINPKYAEAFNNRGVAYAQQGKSVDAFNDFTKAIALNPDYAEAYNNRSNLYVQEGKLTKALSDLNKSIKIDPENADVFSNRGVTFAQQDKPNQALADFTKTLELNPNDAGALNNRSNLLAQKGEFTQALSDLNRSIKINPDYAEAYFNRGNIYYRQKDLTRAIADYSEAVELNPQDEKVYSNLVAICLELKNFDKAWSYVRQAREAGFSIPPELIEALKTASGINDKAAGDLNKRGIIFVRQGKLPQAFISFSKAIEMDPFYAEAYNNRSNLYAQKGEFTKALSDLNKSIENNPEDPNAYFNRGNVYYRQNNPAQAVADYNQAIKLAPQFEKAYSNLIAIYSALNDFDKAWSCVHRAQEAGCVIKTKIIGSLMNLSETKLKTAEAFSSRGVIYAQQGNFSQAYADFNRAIDTNPKYAEAYNNRSNLYGKTGNFKKALYDLNKAIGLNPHFSKAFFNRGELFYSQNDFPKAIADFAKAIELNPHYEKAYNNLISLYFVLKDFDKAWGYVRQAQMEGVPVDPKFIKALKVSRRMRN